MKKIIIIPLLTVLWMSANSAQATDVTTYHNDLSRTGQNNSETILNRSNVNQKTFGQIGSLPVDGLIQGQPLVVRGVPVPNPATGGVVNRDLVFVATEHDSVYAWDYNLWDPNDPSQLLKEWVWKTSFLEHFPLDPQCGTATATASTCACPAGRVCDAPTSIEVRAPNIAPEVGIAATPVIDMSVGPHGAIYVTAMTKEDNEFFWKLHALDLATGAELFTPAVINAILPGNGSGSNNGLIRFYASMQLSRMGLSIDPTTHNLYIMFASFDDRDDVGYGSHGWVFAYDSKTLNFRDVWMTTPNYGLGTIWQAGGAPAIDGNGNIYFSTANGDPELESPKTVDLGNSVIKLAYDPTRKFHKNQSSTDLTNDAPDDWFTPYTNPFLNTADVDLGSGGVLLLPPQPGAHPNLLVAGGKEGTVYLIDRDHFSDPNSPVQHYNQDPHASSDPQIVQELPYFFPGNIADGPGIYGTASFFHSDADAAQGYDGKIFIAAAGDYLTSIPLKNGKLLPNASDSTDALISVRGATTSITSNGSKDGIVWYLDPSAYTYNGDYFAAPTSSDGRPVLYAYNSDTLKLLYHSPLNVNVNDRTKLNAPGNAVKFAVPTVANGNVFVGTRQQLTVFGLLPVENNPNPEPYGNDMNVYPNPVPSNYNWLNMMPKIMSWGSQQVELVEVGTGRVVYANTLDFNVGGSFASEQHINVANFASGMYILRISEPTGGMFTTKIVINH